MPNHDQGITTIRSLLPTLLPVGSVVASILSIAVAFTKVQMESTAHALQLSALEGRIDRFQDAFDKFRAEANHDNRERDRMIERSTAMNEVQNSRMEQLLGSLRRLDDIYRERVPRQNYEPELLPPPPPMREAQRGLDR